MDQPVHLMGLSDVDVRVLGVLAEKEMTVPETYPMSLNAIVTGCNQTTNRWPVLALTASDAERSLDRLRADHQLVRKMFAGAGSRTDKYRHVMEERLGLSRPEKAIMTVLLLRGPQTPGELKSRTDRMHDFADLGVIEAVLDRLGDPRLGADPEEPTDRRDTGALRTAADGPALRDGYARPWDGPLVVRLERQPGQKEARFAHTLGVAIATGGFSDAGPAGSPSRSGADSGVSLAQRVMALEAEMAELKAAFETFRSQF
jgi:uncharacterized protein